LLLFWAGGVAQADRKREAEAVAIGPPPPMAQNVQISVYRGETITIPLTARGRVPLDTKFFIRSRPRAGELSDVFVEGPGRGTITYRHRGGEAPMEDSFTYAAQAGDSPVSAPARVRIFVMERPAELVAPEAVEFGRGLIGRGEERWITLANAGGATFRADLKVDDGWEIMGERAVEIHGGQAVRVAVRFQPREERSYLGALRFSHDEKTMVRLSGEGVDPVRWFPQSIAWTGTEEPGGVKEIEVQNRSDEEITLVLSGGEGISLPEEVRVGAESSARIAVRADPAQRQGAQGMIRLRHPFGEAQIPYQIAALPARLEIEPPGWDLGEVVEGQTVEQEIRIRNAGGTATVVALTPPIGLEIEGAMDRTLPPEGEEKFVLRFRAGGAGVFTREMEIRHGGTAHPWPIRARITEAALAPGLEPSRSPQFSTTAEPTPQPTELFALQNLQPTERTRSTVGFEWTQEISPNDRLIVEERQLSVAPGGGLAIHWLATEQIQLTRLPENRWRATIVGLTPGARKFLRVRWESADGITRGISDMLAVQSEPRTASGGFPWRSLGLLALASASVWLWWRRRHRTDPETEARLRDLERR
jgi:hypothetical protein